MITDPWDVLKWFNKHPEIKGVLKKFEIPSKLDSSYCFSRWIFFPEIKESDNFYELFRAVGDGPSGQVQFIYNGEDNENNTDCADSNACLFSQELAISFSQADTQKILHEFRNRDESYW
jgi:hypothetical protein